MSDPCILSCEIASESGSAEYQRCSLENFLLYPLSCQCWQNMGREFKASILLYDVLAMLWELIRQHLSRNSFPSLLLDILV